FLSIGYSFTDGISKRVLDELNKNNLKNERKIINIDPFPNDALIPFLEEHNVVTIKLTSSDFFDKYDAWEKNNLERVSKRLSNSFFKSKNSPTPLPAKLKLRL